MEAWGRRSAAEVRGRSVRKGGLAVAAAILLSLTWYVLADRYTPYTSRRESRDTSTALRLKSQER